MMLSKVEAGKKNGEDSSSGKLLHDIETISKALYVHKNTPRNSISAAVSRSISTGKAPLPDLKSKVKASNGEQSRKDKKSVWNWRPLKALSHIRSRRFNCCFSLKVHSIVGLPSDFNDLSLCVYWKRRDGVQVTCPAKVSQGLAEFEEKLTHICSVYGSRSGPHHSAKYEERHFLLYASLHGTPEQDLGKHRVDLTRLLPLTLEELEDENNSGKWTTSFRLLGKARGATMNVSFGYKVLGDNSSATGNNHNAPDVLNLMQKSPSLVNKEMKLNHADRSRLQRVGSLPSPSGSHPHMSSQSVEDFKDLHEVSPLRSELTSSVDFLYQKFDEDKSSSPVLTKLKSDAMTKNVDPVEPDSYPLSGSVKDNTEEVELKSNEYSVIDQGIEQFPKEPVKLEENIAEASDVSLPNTLGSIESNTGRLISSEHGGMVDSGDKENGCSKDEQLVTERLQKEDGLCTKESLLKELDLALNNVSDLERMASESPQEENYMDDKFGDRSTKKGESHKLDDVTESVASEFLSMLGIEHSAYGLSSESEPESPRERLLRQFEKEALAEGCSLFNFDMPDENTVGGFDVSTRTGLEDFTEDFDLSVPLEDVQEKHPIDYREARSKTRAKMLEDLETEALMREWGFNEKAFQESPPKSSTGFGSPIHLSHEEPLGLPSLGEGVGPFLQTKDGGFLRSMNPSLFRNAKSGGSLIMQVSSPVVVPADLGSGITEILQRLASVGIENLSMQANKLMPLEDITGKTVQQVALEAIPFLEGPERQCLLQQNFMTEQDSTEMQKGVSGRSLGQKSNRFSTSSDGNEAGSEYVSLEDLAPLAMDKIEALSIEGLRIQSGMSDEDAPSNIHARSIGDVSALQGKGVDTGDFLGLEGAAGLQLLDIKDTGDDVDGIMGLSLTLDEWMRLDSGAVEDADSISEHTSKILAAHHANSFDFIRQGSKGDRKRGKGPGRKCGLLGNNFTVALMVQLRDPLRNYEPVGAPMLALIQVERVFLPPKPKIYSTVSVVRKTVDEDDESEPVVKVEKEDMTEEKSSEEEGIAHFRITEAHVAGLKTEPAKKNLWGKSTQEQSGSRWLLANGMGKSNKHPFMKSKSAKSSAPATTKVQSGDALWRVSAPGHGAGAKSKGLAELNARKRNSDIIFPTVKLR